MKIIIPTDKAYLEISLVEPVASLAGVPQLEPEDSFNQSIPSTKLPYQKLDSVGVSPIIPPTGTYSMYP